MNKALFAIIDADNNLLHIGQIKEGATEHQILLREKKYGGKLKIFTDYGDIHSQLVSLRGCLKRGSNKHLSKVLGQEVTVAFKKPVGIKQDVHCITSAKVKVRRAMAVFH